jgi:hypothetical protein
VSLPEASSSGDEAFENCTALTDVKLGTFPPGYFAVTIPWYEINTLGNDIFRNTGSGTITIRYPAASLSALVLWASWVSANASHWGRGAKTIVQGTY